MAVYEDASGCFSGDVAGDGEVVGDGEDGIDENAAVSIRPPFFSMTGNEPG